MHTDAMSPHIELIAAGQMLTDAMSLTGGLIATCGLGPWGGPWPMAHGSKGHMGPMGPWGPIKIGPFKNKYPPSQINYKPIAQGVFGHCWGELWSLKKLMWDAVLKLMKQWNDAENLRGDHLGTTKVQVYK